MRLFPAILFSFLWLFSIVIHLEGASLEGSITYEEFQSIVLELAPKVDAFKAIWDKDPAAQILGGAVRDFLYWIKQQFADVKNRDDALKKVEELKKLSSLQVFEFMSPESDIDFIYQDDSPRSDLEPSEYQIRRFEAISPERLKPGSKSYEDEIHQGYLPTEKLILGSKSISTIEGFGDGTKEIYDGNLSVQLPDPVKFRETSYALQNLNHPILISFRFLRALTRESKSGTEQQRLSIDKLKEKYKSEFERISGIIDQLIKNHELEKPLKEPRFAKWLNGIIKKLFDPRNDRHLSDQFFEYFNIDRLYSSHGKKLDPINFFRFHSKKNIEVADKLIQSLGYKPEEIFGKVEVHFPDGAFYHGVKDIESLRSIDFAGVMPSKTGAFGPGLYGTNFENKVIALHYAEQRENQVVSFPVVAGARILDMTSDLARKIRKQFKSDDQMAEALQADILIYPFPLKGKKQKMALVKYISALGPVKMTGPDRKTSREILASIDTLSDPVQDLSAFIETLKLNPPKDWEMEQILDTLQAKFPSPLLEKIKKFHTNVPMNAAARIMLLQLWHEFLQFQKSSVQTKSHDDGSTQETNILNNETNFSPELIVEFIGAIKNSVLTKDSYIQLLPSSSPQFLNLTHQQLHTIIQEIIALLLLSDRSKTLSGDPYTTLFYTELRKAMKFLSPSDLFWAALKSSTKKNRLRALMPGLYFSGVYSGINALWDPNYSLSLRIPLAVLGSSLNIYFLLRELQTWKNLVWQHMWTGNSLVMAAVYLDRYFQEHEQRQQIAVQFKFQIKSGKIKRCIDSLVRGFIHRADPQRKM